ncbi:MAG: hypothetical protein M3416_06045 [Acidobacteriota bacterium]|nr:hypothetical protein [Acidobacteriota bacterium]
MRRKYFPVGRSVPAALCSLVLVGFVAAQMLPAVRDSLRPHVKAAGQSVAGVSPTPAPPPEAAERFRPQSQSRSRDLSRYDKAGPLSVGAELQRPERDAVLAQARGFLLEHWRGRRHGQLVLHLPDADGRPLPYSLYVEPDEAGQWSVVLETAGGTETFRFVEEVELSEEGQPILEPTAEDAPRLTGRRGLHLKESPQSNSGLVL